MADAKTVVRKRVAVTVDGVEYKSRSAAAIALVDAGKTLSEAAEATGMTYQTVYSVTKGADKVKVRRTKYRILSLGKRGKKTASEIAKKVGVSTPKVVAILKKSGVVIVSKDSQSAANPKAKKAKQKVTKPVIDEVPLTPEQVQVEEAEVFSA